jgi:hypothetical protein
MDEIIIVKRVISQVIKFLVEHYTEEVETILKDYKKNNRKTDSSQDRKESIVVAQSDEVLNLSLLGAYFDKYSISIEKGFIKLCKKIELITEQSFINLLEMKIENVNSLLDEYSKISNKEYLFEKLPVSFHQTNNNNLLYITTIEREIKDHSINSLISDTLYDKSIRVLEYRFYSGLQSIVKEFGSKFDKIKELQNANLPVNNYIETLKRELKDRKTILAIKLERY